MPLEVRTTSPIQCSRTVHSIKKPAGSFIAIYPERASLTLLTPGLVQVCLSKIRYHFHIQDKLWPRDFSWNGNSGDSDLVNNLEPEPLSDCWQLSLEKAMATHSSTFAWKIPWTEEPGGLQSLESLELDTTERLTFTFMHWRRKWQPTPVFLPGESPGPGSLVGCRLWGRTELDTTEAT